MSSSLGFHTFTIVLRLTRDAAFAIYRAFQAYPDVRVRPIGKVGKNPIAFPKGYVVEYIGRGRGITWYVRFDDKLAPFMEMSLDPLNRNYQKEPEPYSVRATINPKILNGTKNYLTAADDTCLDSVEALFNREAAKISPALGRFELYSVNRADYCFNCDTAKLRLGCSSKQLIILMKRGDIPAGFTEWTEYDEKSHRQKPSKNAFYLRNKSLTINCYRKQAQLLEKFPDCPDLEASRDLIRFEVQCQYPKVYTMAKGNRDRSKLYKFMSGDELWEDFLYGRLVTNPIDVLLSNAVATTVIRKYLHKVVRGGDYLTLDGARWMVRAHNFRRDREERLLFALEQVNECRGVAKAKSKLLGDDLQDFKRSLRDLDGICVNPVTIPRKWSIDHIQNPLRAYYNSFAGEQLVPVAEIEFSNLLAEYQSKR